MRVVREPGDAAAGSLKLGLSLQSWAKGEWVCARPPPRLLCRGLGEQLRAPPGPAAAEGRGLSVRAVGAGGSRLCVWL